MSSGRGREYSKSVVFQVLMVVDVSHVDDRIVNVTGEVQDLLLSSFQAMVL